MEVQLKEVKGNGGKCLGNEDLATIWDI